MKNKLLLVLPATSLFVGALAIAGPQNFQAAQATSLEPVKSTLAITYPATIVELFTSQGCSSCPPTNKLVHDIASTENILALSYSVDYWDYLGWKDTLGNSEFSARQRTYGKHQFQGQVYTPQIILNGDAHAARFRPDQIIDHKLQKSAAELTLNKTPEGITVHAKGQGGTLVEVRYTPGSQSVPVARGENRGRTITLANVVTSIKTLGSWKKNDGYEAILIPLPEGEAVAILVQDGDGGPILTAANYTP